MYPAALPRRRTAPSRTPASLQRQDSGRPAEDGCATVGIGRDAGGVLPLSLLGYGPEAAWDMGLLALFLIDAMAAVNPYVPPLAAEADGLCIRRRRGGHGPAGARGLPGVQRAKKRIQLIRALWRLAETCGEEAVEKALEALKPSSGSEETKNEDAK